MENYDRGLWQINQHDKGDAKVNFVSKFVRDFHHKTNIKHKFSELWIKSANFVKINIKLLNWWYYKY